MFCCFCVIILQLNRRLHSSRLPLKVSGAPGSPKCVNGGKNSHSNWIHCEFHFSCGYNCIMISSFCFNNHCLIQLENRYEDTGFRKKNKDNDSLLLLELKMWSHIFYVIVEEIRLIKIAFYSESPDRKYTTWTSLFTSQLLFTSSDLSVILKLCQLATLRHKRYNMPKEITWNPLACRQTFFSLQQLWFSIFQ